MARIAINTARVCLFCFGLLLVSMGLARFVIPDGFYSDAPPPNPWLVDMMINSGAVGYGVLLVASPRSLAKSPRAYWSLVALTVVFGVGIAIDGAARFSAIQTSAGVAARMWPAAVAMILVTLESKQPDTVGADGRTGRE